MLPFLLSHSLLLSARFLLLRPPSSRTSLPFPSIFFPLVLLLPSHAPPTRYLSLSHLIYRSPIPPSLSFLLFLLPLSISHSFHLFLSTSFSRLPAICHPSYPSSIFSVYSSSSSHLPPYPNFLRPSSSSHLPPFPPSFPPFPPFTPPPLFPSPPPTTDFSQRQERIGKCVCLTSLAMAVFGAGSYRGRVATPPLTPTPAPYPLGRVHKPSRE